MKIFITTLLALIILFSSFFYALSIFASSEIRDVEQANASYTLAKVKSMNLSESENPTDSLQNLNDAVKVLMITEPKVNKQGTKEIKVYNSKYVIPDELRNNLYNVIRSYSTLNIGIHAISLKDYTCIGYNESFSIATSSTVKAPFALYVMKEIAAGKHTLDEKVKYESKHLNTGSGVIKNSKFGTEFSVEYLMTQMIHESDNIAFLMLQDYFGYQGYNEMISNLGCNIWLNGYTQWGFYTAEELAIIWNEIYNFSKETDEGKYLLDLLINAKYNFMKDNLGRYSKVAHKSGFTDTSYNDAAIIFTDSDLNPELGHANDYIIVFMSNPGDSGFNRIAMGNIAKEIDMIMRDLATHQ